MLSIYALYVVYLFNAGKAMTQPLPESNGCILKQVYLNTLSGIKRMINNGPVTTTSDSTGRAKLHTVVVYSET